jgi:hypothetical protein
MLLLGLLKIYSSCHAFSLFLISKNKFFVPKNSHALCNYIPEGYVFQLAVVKTVLIALKDYYEYIFMG